MTEYLDERFHLTIQIDADRWKGDSRHVRSELKKLAGDAVWEALRSRYGDVASDVAIR
jgi:hypothetical protein